MALERNSDLKADDMQQGFSNVVSVNMSNLCSTKICPPHLFLCFSLTIYYAFSSVIIFLLASYLKPFLIGLLLN